MGRPKGSSNVSGEEVARIRRLYREGVRLADIAAQVDRSLSVVERATRDLKRKRPPPPKGRHALRNDFVLALVEAGLTRERVGELVGLRPSQVSTIVANHPHVIWLLRVRKTKPATIARRYRMELSTAERIARGEKRGHRPRTWTWGRNQ